MVDGPRRSLRPQYGSRCLAARLKGGCFRSTLEVVTREGDEHGRSRRYAGAALAAAALLVTVPAAAHAGGDEGIDLGTAGGLNYRVNISDDFGGDALSSFVACLGGARPIAGGIDLQGSATASRMGGSYPVKEFGPLIWRTTGHNLIGGTMDMSFFGICREKQPTMTRFPSVTRPFNPNKQRTVRAPCPQGFRVTGGGIQSSNPLVSANRPYDGKDEDKKPDDGWKVTALNLQPIPEELTAHASCRKAGSWDLKYLREEGTVGGGSSTVSTDICPAGVVAGGGASISGAAGTVRLHETYPADVGDIDETPEDGWTTSLRNGGMGPANGVFYAICKV